MFLWIYLYVVEIAHMSSFGYYILWMYLWVDDMATWGVCYISAVMLYYWNFYACQLRVIWRCDVYFLIIYYIRVIYHFDRNRALHFEHTYYSKNILSPPIKWVLGLHLPDQLIFLSVLYPRFLLGRVCETLGLWCSTWCSNTGNTQ